MGQNTVFIIIGILVACGIIAAIAYHVARFMRGSIKLILLRTAFNPGETITGNFELLTKKQIQGNKLIISLIGTQVTKTYEDGKSQTRSHEIYRNEVLLEEAKQYTAGSTETYNFEIPAPDLNSPEFLNSKVGQALTATLGLLTKRSSQLKWRIEARLDAKGVDLVASKSVSINNI